MTKFSKTWSCFLLSSAVWIVNGDSTFAGSAITSDSSGTRSVLISGRNGVGIQSRLGGGSTYGRVGGATVAGGSVGGPSGTYVSTGSGPGGAYAGPGGAFASAGGASAFAGAGFPYWNGAGSYASAGGGAYSYPYYQSYPNNYNNPYPYSGSYGGGGGSGEVYSGSDSNGIQTRFANVGPGGQATIVEQDGDEEPRVYTYRGTKRSDKYD